MSAKILVLTHGKLAQTFVETVQLITGDVKNFEYRNLPDELDINQYYDDLKKIVEKCLKEGILVVVDLLGGSPFLIASRLINEYRYEQIEIITGCNLSMLLELANTEGNVQELKSIAIQSGKQGIKDLRDIWREQK